MLDLPETVAVPLPAGFASAPDHLFADRYGRSMRCHTAGHLGCNRSLKLVSHNLHDRKSLILVWSLGREAHMARLRRASYSKNSHNTVEQHNSFVEGDQGQREGILP